MNQPYESFYHGLVTSKLWLCEELEKILDARNIDKPVMKILGSWHNLLSFMMIVRRPTLYLKFDCYDKDPECKPIADQICNTWYDIQEPIVRNYTADVLALNFSQEMLNTIFINCSVDQFENSSWYNTITFGRIVCIQTTDIVDDSQDWEILQKTKNLRELKARYPMTEVLFEGTKSMRYKDGSYNRLMLIGIK